MSEMLDKIKDTVKKDLITGIISNVLVGIILFVTSEIFKVGLIKNVINSQLGWFSLITLFPCILGLSIWKKESFKFKVGVVVLTIIAISSFIISGTTNNPDQLIADLKETHEKYTKETQNQQYEISILQNSQKHLKDQISLLDDSKKQADLIVADLSNKNNDYAKIIDSKNKEINQLKQDYEIQIKKLKSEKPSLITIPNKKDLNQILSLSNQKRDESIKQLEDKVSQIQLLTYAGIKNEYTSRMTGMSMSQKAIDTVQQVYKNYINALEGINRIKIHFIKLLNDEYDKMLVNNFNKPLLEYQTILLNRPITLDKFDKVSEELKAIIGSNQNDFNSKIENYIDKYFNENRASSPK